MVYGVEFLAKLKQFKTLTGQRFYRAIHGRPKSLGDGLRRVVGRNARLVSQTTSAPTKVDGSKQVGHLFGIETEGGIVTRRYSNGVVLQRGDISAGLHCEHRANAIPFRGDQVLAVSKNGKMTVARQSRTWSGSFDNVQNYSRDVVTANNSQYVSRTFRDGTKIKEFERNNPFQELGMYEEAFRALAT